VPAATHPAALITAPRAVLIVKTSSLGDVVHGLPVASDLRATFPEARIDWVVEEAYGELPRLHPAVGDVIPVAIRRWRQSLGSAATWRELGEFSRLLKATAYDVVIDLQGLIKSALIARAARLSPHGQRCGYAPEAAREPLAARFYQRRVAIPRSLHAVLRNRWLTAAALGYAVPEGLDYGIVGWPDRGSERWPASPYAVLLTSTSRSDKHWSRAGWLALAAALQAQGLAIVLPSGTPAERAEAGRLAAGMARAQVAPPLSLAELVQLFAGAKLVVGLDTGLTHLAAALGRPTLALFAGSDPELTGVHAGQKARNLGGPRAPPEPAAAVGVAQELLALAPAA
jgi:heptosyltransferase-1